MESSGLRLWSIGLGFRALAYMVQVPPGFPKGSSYQVVWRGIVVASVVVVDDAVVDVEVVAVAVVVAAAVAPKP